MTEFSESLDMAEEIKAQWIVRLVERARLPLDNEKRVQLKLAELFMANDVTAVREVRLDDGDIPDFMVGGIAVEVKIKGSKMDIYRQLKRYAQHERVRRLVLITNVAMGLPAEIEGKPTHIASLGKGWL